MRFLNLSLSGKVLDAKIIWLFRENLVRAGAIGNLFARFDKHLSRSGYLAKGGQIIDATIIQAPRQHNSQNEKAAIKATACRQLSSMMIEANCTAARKVDLSLS